MTFPKTKGSPQRWATGIAEPVPHCKDFWVAQRGNQESIHDPYCRQGLFITKMLMEEEG